MRNSWDSSEAEFGSELESFRAGLNRMEYRKQFQEKDKMVRFHQILTPFTDHARCTTRDTLHTPISRKMLCYIGILS